MPCCRSAGRRLPAPLPRVHRSDIDRHFPLYSAGAADGRSAYLVQHGDETAGVIVVRDEGNGTAQVEIDYVTPALPRLHPGEYVFRRSGSSVSRASVGC